MADYITPEDLAPFADIPEDKAQAMIDDAVAMAVQVAPCIESEEFQNDPAKMAALKAILRSAILRWNDSGSGAITQQTAGPFQQSIDTRTTRRGMYWPSEIDELQNLCQAGPGGAYTLDTFPVGGVNHADICSINFGATYCSCGAILTRGEYPLWEGGVITQGTVR